MIRRQFYILLFLQNDDNRDITTDIKMFTKYIYRYVQYIYLSSGYISGYKNPRFEEQAMRHFHIRTYLYTK